MPEENKARKAKVAPPVVIDGNQRYNVEEAIATLRSSRRTFYEDVAAGRIKLIKDRSRSYVLGDELIRRSRDAS